MSEKPSRTQQFEAYSPSGERHTVRLPTIETLKSVLKVGTLLVGLAWAGLVAAITGIVKREVSQHEEVLAQQQREWAEHHEDEHDQAMRSVRFQVEELFVQQQYLMCRAAWLDRRRDGRNPYSDEILARPECLPWRAGSSP